MRAHTAAICSTTACTTARGSSSSSPPSRSAPDADPPKADRLNRARVQKRLLERLAGRAFEPAIEVRAPFEVPLLEADQGLPSNRFPRMEVIVFFSPPREIRRTDRLAAGRDQHAMLPFVPVTRRVVHPIPRELVEDQERRHSRDFLQRGAEWLEMVKHA